MSILLNQDEKEVPTSMESASSMGAVSNVRFVNDTGSEAMIYYLNSSCVQLGSVTLSNGESVVLKKRRNFHKFYRNYNSISIYRSRRSKQSKL